MGQQSLQRAGRLRGQAFQDVLEVTLRYNTKMKLSTLLIVLGGLLSATTFRWSQIFDRRTSSEIYQDAKAGKQRVTLYARIIAPISVIIILVGIYLALTWQ